MERNAFNAGFYPPKIFKKSCSFKKGWPFLRNKKKNKGHTFNQKTRCQHLFLANLVKKSYMEYPTVQQKASYQLLLCQLEKAPKGVVSPPTSTARNYTSTRQNRVLAACGRSIALQPQRALGMCWTAKKRRQCYCFWTPRRVRILIEDDKWILSCLMNVTIITRNYKLYKVRTLSATNCPLF